MEASRSEKEIRDRLLKSVKKEVKQIMEEAVTRKFVHEESSSITSLCGAVETCVQYGLKKRTLGLFKNNNSTSALLTKISKSYEPATQVTKILNDLDVNANEAKKSIDNNKNQTGNLKKTPSNYNPKYLWIRLALFEKVLAGIIDHLAQNNSKYYEKESVLADPVDGPILASLLVGPCALDFTKMKTTDHFWTDPPADELVQRHRIHSSGNHYQGPGSPRKLGLQVRMNPSLSSDEGSRASPLSAKEYVESLHQNSKTTLLYGKNNVMVQPKEDVERMAGYLSLHQGVEGLSVKWTPNQLMNGCCELDENGEDVDRSLYWEYAVTVYLDEIVYLHCHQQPDSGGTIVLVGQDGVQRPPIHFPKGGHLLAFLSCLETGLLPHGQLDPPLWSQRGKEEELPSFPAFLAQLESKVFPKLLRKGSQRAVPGQKSESLDEAEVMTCDAEEATDYVFRIISTFRPENLHADLMDPKNIRNGSNTNGSNNWAPRDKLRHTSSSSSTSSTASIQSYARNQQQVNATMLLGQGQGTGTHHRCAVKQLCDTMKRQIISRAFYGWLAHCRHLKTVRTHLSGLVNHQVISVEEPCDASKGLTAEIWLNLFHDGVVTDVQEVYRLVYYGGVEHSIRKEVWPFLLGHYKFGSTVEEREQLATETRQQYENTMSEWLAVEAIVRQRDKEIMAANFAKLSSESQDGQIPLVRKDSSLSNDVFEDNYSMTSDDVDRDFQGNEPESLAEEGAVSLDSSKIQTPESLDEGVGDMTKTLKSQRSCDSTTTDRSIIVTNPSVDSGSGTDAGDGEQEQTVLPSTSSLEKVTESPSVEALGVDIEEVLLNASRESLVSPASPASNGGIYSTEMLESVALNLHRIDKDVQRCDRNYFYFNRDNLEKLKNVMCTYVWEHLEIGYVQGMCDLVAPLLVIFDDEALTYSCFCELMKRMTANFPHGGAMDIHFANMRSLIQILDSELFEHMHQNGDYTHFYFCYRWFLLDFKRELVYDDVFVVWETIWSAKYISSSNFVLFIALALVEYYREIILDNNMDFTDIIKFFNEMAERHNAKQVLKISRDLVHRLQDLIENK